MTELKLIAGPKIGQSFLLVDGVLLDPAHTDAVLQIAERLVRPRALADLVRNPEQAALAVDLLGAPKIQGAVVAILAAPWGVKALAENGQARPVYFMIAAQHRGAQAAILASPLVVKSLAENGLAMESATLIAELTPPAQKIIFDVAFVESSLRNQGQGAAVDTIKSGWQRPLPTSWNRTVGDWINAF